MVLPVVWCHLDDFSSVLLSSREVGGRKLTVGTRLVRELQEFGGDLSLEGLHLWKTAFCVMTHPATTITSSQGAEVEQTKEEKTGLLASSASDKKVVLLPCRNPPSHERVQLWLEARKQYDSLQKERREPGKKREGADVEQENPDRTNLPDVSRCISVNVEHYGNTSSVRTRRRKKLSLSLALSPLVDTGPRSNTTTLSLVSDESTVSPQPEKQEDASNTVSPESPELPPWQEPHQLSPLVPERLGSKNSPESPSPRLPDSQERFGADQSPFPFHGADGNGGSSNPHRLHTTPFLRKRRRSTEDLDPVCSTPISYSKFHQQGS